jgi:hypothetical protein
MAFGAVGDAPLKRIAIVDENPAEQYLAPEFELFRQLFEANGIAAVVADPANSAATAIACCTTGEPVDLVYNRLTDFSLMLRSTPICAVFVPAVPW